MNLIAYGNLYFIKAKLVGSSIFTKKGFLLAPAIVPVTLAKTTGMAIEFLIFLMITDFFTGIGASYFETKKASKVKVGLVDIISSEKLKRSGLKFMLYSLTILTAFFLQKIFQLKTFTLLVSDMKLNLVIGVIGFWCVVECYSIFFENFKKMGIDVKATIKKITDLVTFFKEKSKDVCK